MFATRVAPTAVWKRGMIPSTFRSIRTTVHFTWRNTQTTSLDKFFQVNLISGQFGRAKRQYTNRFSLLRNKENCFFFFFTSLVYLTFTNIKKQTFFYC